MQSIKKIYIEPSDTKKKSECIFATIYSHSFYQLLKIRHNSWFVKSWVSKKQSKLWSVYAEESIILFAVCSANNALHAPSFLKRRNSKICLN